VQSKTCSLAEQFLPATKTNQEKIQEKISAYPLKAPCVQHHLQDTWRLIRSIGTVFKACVVICDHNDRDD